MKYIFVLIVVFCRATCCLHVVLLICLLPGGLGVRWIMLSFGLAIL